METAEAIYLIVVALVLGGLIGYGVCYATHEYKCKHQWEKIINDTEVNNYGRTTGHIVVHMCKKCGKRNITKV